MDIPKWQLQNVVWVLSIANTMVESTLNLQYGARPGWQPSLVLV